MSGPCHGVTKGGMFCSARAYTQRGSKFYCPEHVTDPGGDYQITHRQFEDLVRRADAYILALRQVLYSKKPDVIESAKARLNELGSCWRAARESCASDIPEKY